jgi:uncharacterized phiE125 gp8 family phage protein
MADVYTITTPPESLPVTLEEVKLHLRVDNTIDDILIDSLINAAVDSLEKYSNRVFISRTIKGEFDNACLSKFERWPYLELRRSPLVSVTNVQVTSGGVQSAFTDFSIKNLSGFSRLLITDTMTFDTDIAYAIEVNFVAGYGDIGDVPETIKNAIKLLVGFWYENRGDVAPDGKQGIPIEVQSIMNQYRVLATYA